MNKKKIRKRSVTLIEVLIASTLSLILLTAVNYCYHQVHLINRESEKLYQEQFKESVLEKRLSAIMTKIVAPNTKQRDFYFFTSEAEKKAQDVSLVFTFDNGVTFEKQFSNHVLGRLFLDKNDNLTLILLPSPKSWVAAFNQKTNLEMKREILMEKVASLSFEFYLPPKKELGPLKKKYINNGLEIEENAGWIKSWKTGYLQLPALIKIAITLKSDENKTISFLFAVPNSDFMIMYD